MAVRLVVRPPEGKADYALTFDQQKIAVGRGTAVDLRLPHPAVSELHAVIRLEGQDYLVSDPGSTNGTTLNGAPLVRGRPRLLRGGDRLGIAGFEVRFYAGAAMEGAHTAERTAALALRMVREAIDALGAGGAPPRLVFLNGARAGERIDLGAVPCVLVVGRGETCDVVLEDADASRRHFELRRDWNGVTVRDLGAKNVTLVGGEPARERLLHDRDEILVGSTRFVFEDPAETYLAALQEIEADAPAPAPSPSTEEIPPTRVREGTGDTDGAGPSPGSPPGTPVEAGPAPGERRPLRPRAEAHPPASRPTAGDWFVVVVGVLVLAGSIVAIFYVFQ